MLNRFQLLTFREFVFSPSIVYEICQLISSVINHTTIKINRIIIHLTFYKYLYLSKLYMGSMSACCMFQTTKHAISFKMFFVETQILRSSILDLILSVRISPPVELNLQIKDQKQSRHFCIHVHVHVYNREKQLSHYTIKDTA